MSCAPPRPPKSGHAYDQQYRYVVYVRELCVLQHARVYGEAGGANVAVGLCLVEKIIMYRTEQPRGILLSVYISLTTYLFGGGGAGRRACTTVFDSV